MATYGYVRVSAADQNKDYALDEIRDMYGTSGQTNSRGSVKIGEGAMA